MQASDFKLLRRNIVIALALQIIGVILPYTLQVFLARWMGKTEYGIYNYALTLSLLLAIPAGLGLPRTVVRFIATYRVQEQWGKLRGLLFSSWLLTLVVGLGICLAATLFLPLLRTFQTLTYASVLLVGIWLVPLHALARLQEDMARGANHIILAYGPTQVLWPCLGLICGFVIFDSYGTLNSLMMTQLAIVLWLTVILFQVLLLGLKFKQEILSAKPIFKLREWLTVALPLLLQRTFQRLLTQTDTLMIGMFVGVAGVGLYSAAAKTALWVNFVLQTINLVAAPTFAAIHTQGDRPAATTDRLQSNILDFCPSLSHFCQLNVFCPTHFAGLRSRFCRSHLGLTNFSLWTIGACVLWTCR